MSKQEHLERIERRWAGLWAAEGDDTERADKHLPALLQLQAKQFILDMAWLIVRVKNLQETRP